MILKDLLNHFEIEVKLPDYLLDESFNEIFLEGDLSRKDNSFEITIKTRQNVTHHIFINENDEYPIVIMSELPNGSLNGMKFGQNNGDTKYINQFPKL